jgi:hypothetical protein
MIFFNLHSDKSPHDENPASVAVAEAEVEGRQ